MNRLLYLFILLPFLARAQTIHISGADTVCAGTSVHFTATTTGVASPYYRWQVNGVNTGADSSGLIIDSVANGDLVRCLLTDSLGSVLGASNSIVMTVQHLQGAGVIVGPDSVCVGAAITLTDSVTGGLWSASNTSASVAEGVVRGVSAHGWMGVPSVDTICYVVTEVCGADTAIKIVEVDTIPYPQFTCGIAIGPPEFICVGQQEMIWNCDDNMPSIRASNSNLSVNFDVLTGFGYLLGANPGTDTLITSAQNACGSYTFTQVVTIGDIPSAGRIWTSVANVCVGDTMVLEDTSFTGSARWTASSDNVVLIGASGSTRELVAGIKPGEDFVTLSVSNLCGSNQASFTFSVGKPSPIGKTDSLCRGNAVTLTDATRGGTWSSSNPLVAPIDSLSGIITGLKFGETTITYSVGAGCYDTMNISVGICGADVAIYPNPASGDLNIYTLDTFYFFQFINITGQVVLQQPVTGIVTNVDVRFLPAGMYTIALYGDNKRYVTKFVKE